MTGKPASAPFESNTFPVRVIVVYGSEGGWHVNTVLCRDVDGPVTPVAPWTQPWRPDDPNWTRSWDYLAERMRDGSGGNGISYEIQAYEVADPAHIIPIVNADAAEAVVFENGPLGNTVGTITTAGPDAHATVMPLLLLRDERGHPALVATQLCDSADECVVTAENGAPVQPIPFQSTDQWQHAGSPSWPLHPAQPYLVHWPDGQARLIVTDEATFQLLHTGAAAETGDASPPHDDPLEQPAADTTGHQQQARYNLYRAPVPQWLPSEPDRYIDEPDGYRFAVGDEPSWGFAVPWTFRALASPSTCEPMLEAPRPGSDQFATAYWSALLHLLVYSFGWARPDRGLRWWYDAGKPTDDPRLQLISQVWDADGQLDWFAAWLWTTGMIRCQLTPMLTELTGYHDDGRDLDVDRLWLDRVNRDIQAAGVWAPCGVDGLHLVPHLGNPEGPMGRPHGEPVLLRSGTRKRQAILLLDSMTGWYRALAVHGASLPNLSARSWHVDVIVRPVGWLGTFRRSRETGLWFAGRHRHHARGT